MTTAPDQHEQRQRLNKPRLIEAAVAFADRDGIDALSMRSLAKDLGFGVMSLYTHVANKDEMIDAMVDVVAAEIELPTPDQPWQDAIRSSARSAHDALLRHPWAVAQWPVRSPGPARLAFLNWILEVLAKGGLADSVIYHGYHAVTMHIIGFTQQQLSFEQSLGGMDLEALVTDFLEGDIPAAYPHLAAHARAHIDGDDHGDEFGYVLDLIIDGLARASAGS